MNAALPEKLRDMVGEFKDLEDLEDKYDTLIDFGREVKPIGEEDKREDCLVHGCQSVVHVWATLQDGRLAFHGFADAMIVNGLLSFFVLGCRGLSPEEFLALDPAFIKDTGVVASLTPSRVNGFYNIHKKYVEQVKALAGKD